MPSIPSIPRAARRKNRCSNGLGGRSATRNDRHNGTRCTLTDLQHRGH
jgi:hypothetical protein